MRGTRIPVLVIYDISHDGTRTKVADICLDYGLDRIQYSAFAGELTRTHQEELWLRIKRKVGKRAARIFVVPMATDVWARRLVLEQGDPEPETACAGAAATAAAVSGSLAGAVRSRSRAS